MAVNDPRHMGIETVSLKEFRKRTAGGRFPRRNSSTFHDLEFDCTCGRIHRFDRHTMHVLLELADTCLVLACPDTAALTCVTVESAPPRLVTVFGTWKRTA